MSYRVIALDPGGATGWATYTDSGEGEEPLIGMFHADTLTATEHHFELWSLLTTQHWSGGPYQIVTESFEYRNDSRPGLELISREYIGITKLYGRLTSTPVRLQTAGQGKGFVKDTNIRRLGLWRPGKDNRHAMDATRHLLYWLINNGDDKRLRAQLLEKGWKP